MSDGYVQVAPDSTGKKIDNTQLTRNDDAGSLAGGPGFTTVERQRVDASESLDAVTDLLKAILVELQDMKMALLKALH